MAHLRLRRCFLLELYFFDLIQFATIQNCRLVVGHCLKCGLGVSMISVRITFRSYHFSTSVARFCRVSSLASNFEKPYACLTALHHNRSRQLTTLARQLNGMMTRSHNETKVLEWTSVRLASPAFRHTHHWLCASRLTSGKSVH